MRAISIIKSEHKNLGAVLYSLDKLIEEIDGGKHPDFSIFHGLLTYIDRFLDRYHHPKENHYLFPKLLARAPDTEALVRELGQQHSEGEILFVEMLKALSAYEFSGESEYPRFRDTVLRYTEFERNHAQLEEDKMLPRAREVLEPSDWEEIDAAFEENVDPMFGEQWDNEFSELLKNLINRLPAPLGLGEIWK
ncbi:MAG: hemerythrin domain-containing protein [Gammaproteobacteria bacterium]|nr:MAG: hemerythrin domain-containing protein [Gammaproteobacteria bacterium]UCH39669.1 MAG: hemerythrin domain-containing protein [Gammaproteobacteria bacterium]